MRRRSSISGTNIPQVVDTIVQAFVDLEGDERAAVFSMVVDELRDSARKDNERWATRKAANDKLLAVLPGSAVKPSKRRRRGK